MPTYSYRCTQCSTAFDVQQAFTDDSLTECPSCQGRLRKIFSAVGVTFNGSGFYRTDSRATAAGSSSGGSGGSGESGGSGGSGESGGSKGSDSSRDSKGSGNSTPASTPSPASTPVAAPAAS